MFVQLIFTKDEIDFLHHTFLGTLLPSQNFTTEKEIIMYMMYYRIIISGQLIINDRINANISTFIRKEEYFKYQIMH